MKKLCVIASMLLSLSIAYAQHPVNSYFDEKGSARIQTYEYSEAADTIVETFHRQEDIIWSRTVYRIIDMRYKQNFQLYFPTRSDDPDYHNLFQVITNAVIDGMPIYQVQQDQLKPDYSAPLSKDVFPTIFMADDPAADYSDDPTHYDIAESSAMLINYDSINDQLRFNDYSWKDFMKNQLKYVIQEHIFFDRHTSRLHRRIMAIAPTHADHISTKDSTDVISSVRESMLFWISFTDLRPYLAMQYAIPIQNETKRVTFDDFFQKRLFSSYLLGEDNMYNRLIPEYAYTVKEVKQEQARIEKELLDFEQDLWEY